MTTFAHMTGRVFDIQHFCTHDGPGIRTTVFLKGCPLRCAWCHNPESQKAESEILFSPSLCIGCGLCKEVCPHHDPHRILSDACLREQSCKGCQRCAEGCPTRAIEAAGTLRASGDVLEEVLKDREHYINSGGGMTISGGEPMAQAGFTLELLEKARQAGLHTAIETSGCGRREDFLKATSVTDLFIWDIKIAEPTLYHEYTNGDLSTMTRNLDAVRSSGAEMLLRFLFIPEIHLQESVLEGTRRFIERNVGLPREVIPYHVLGNSKRGRLGLDEIRFREPDNDELAAFRSFIGQ